MTEEYYEANNVRWTDEHGLWVEETKPCAICKELTHRVDIDFECRVHGGGCIDSMWKGYWEACFERPIEHGRL
jgi:hypothetical protein